MRFYYLTIVITSRVGPLPQSTPIMDMDNTLLATKGGGGVDRIKKVKYGATLKN